MRHALQIEDCCDGWVLASAFHMGRPACRGIGIVLLLAAMMLPAGLMTGCQTNEATGRSQVMLLSESREVELGNEAEPQFVNSYGGPIPDPTVTQYISKVGMPLAQLSERPDLPWSFHAVDSSVVNAFALPGGKVFITRGLLSKLENEAQLAAILGHEIGHVTARHINDRMVRQAALAGATLAIGAAAEYSDEDWLRIVGVGAQLGGSVYLLKFSRSEEHEADDLGMRYLVEANYDPIAIVQVMRMLDALGSGGGVEWLSTHPNPGSRAKRLQQKVDQRFPRAGERGAFRTEADRFRDNVLKPLAKLPPPRHTGQQNAQASAVAVAFARDDGPRTQQTHAQAH